jgi:hypothetical protein
MRSTVLLLELPNGLFHQATSGLQLAYLMSAMTSLLDPEAASLLVHGTPSPIFAFSSVQRSTPNSFRNDNTARSQLWQMSLIKWYFSDKARLPRIGRF